MVAGAFFSIRFARVVDGPHTVLQDVLGLAILRVPLMRWLGQK